MKKSVLKKIQTPLLLTYKKLIKEKQKNIIDQCYNFSSLSAYSKSKIQDLLFAVSVQQSR